MDDTDNPQNRDPKTGRVLPGNKLNPGGRPRMSDAERTMLADVAPIAIKKLIDGLEAMQYVGMEGRPEPHWKERREYANALLDRYYGKPNQAITDADGGPVRMGLIFLPPTKPDDAE